MRILLISFILLCSNSYATCKKWKTTYIYGGSKKFKEVYFCLDGQRVFTESCKEKESCPLFHRLKSSTLKPYEKKNSQIGSRGFGLCYEIGAKPSIFRIPEHQNKIIAKCEIRKDFIDTQTLQLWEKEILQK